MRSFASDNNSGISPEVIDAISKANTDHALGYGDDKWSKKAEKKIDEAFGGGTQVLFTFNGTGSNCLALELCTKPWGMIFCAETAHIVVDECGAPGKMTEASIKPIPTPNGKLSAEIIKPYLIGIGEQHHSQPQAIYISQCTELGTVYTPQEIKDITTLAHSVGMYVHMDGARLANACASLSKNLKELTSDCGVDVVSFGGTKNGLMIGECVVVLNEELKYNSVYIRKQSAQLASKQRFLACQFSVYLENDLWLRNAKKANVMAASLRAELEQIPQIKLTQPTESNQLFLIMPHEAANKLAAKHAFFYWNENIGEIRFVTSFDTTKEDIAVLVRDIKEALS